MKKRGMKYKGLCDLKTGSDRLYHVFNVFFKYFQKFRSLLLLILGLVR